MATLQDVADAAGYSVMTASRALSGRGYVSPTASEAVLSAAAALGYVPNGVARSLRRRRTGMIALMISDIENAFYAGIAKAAESLLDAEGYRLFIGSSDEDGEKERRLLTSMLEVRAEALLITPTAANADLLAQLALDGHTIVQLDRVAESEHCSSVLLDNEAAAAEAIRYLASMGHRRIAFISGPRELTTGEERVRGALDAAARLPSRPSIEIVEAGSYLHLDAATAVRVALDREPTAIIAGNNVVAEACVDVLAERGIPVPSAISLITFDDLPWMRWLPSPLTTIRQPVERMTAAAVEIALQSLSGDGPAPVTHVRFPARLIVRDSVAAR
jgi:LacI family transcriptional regulator